MNAYKFLFAILIVLSTISLGQSWWSPGRRHRRNRRVRRENYNRVVRHNRQICGHENVYEHIETECLAPRPAYSVTPVCLTSLMPVEILVKSTPWYMPAVAVAFVAANIMMIAG